MGTTRPGPPGTAPVPVTGGPDGDAPAAHVRRGGRPAAPTAVLAGFHAQSHDKDVSQVETLFFGPSLSNGLALPVPGQERPPLPALGPLRDTGAAGPALGGPWTYAQRLLAACVEAVRVRRVSAADRYPVHRAYPSPRGLFGADLFVVHAADDPAPWILRVDPQSHALQPWGGCRVPDDLEAALTAARLVVAVDHRRYPPEYGRLRPSLALLEGGHLLAALGLTLTRAGLAPRTHLGPTDTPLPYGFSPCGAITLEPAGRPGPPPTPLTPSGRDRVPASDRRTAGASSTPGISAEATRRVAETAAGGAASGTGLRGWLDDRTSGVSTANLVTSAYVSPEDGTGVTSPLVAALAAAQEAVPVPGCLRLYRTVLVDDLVNERAASELTPDGAELPPRPVPRTGETNFASSLGYTLTADFAPWARAHGDGAQSVLHTLLGWVAQWGCLGAAATGLCARPMRNYQEADWAAALGLAPEETPAYQLWVRAERGAFMDTPVDAAR